MHVETYCKQLEAKQIKTHKFKAMLGRYQHFLINNCSNPFTLFFQRIGIVLYKKYLLKNIFPI
jgi:hypothetical protein